MYLSLCLIVKDENSYLQEWLDYHILLGVEHFWVYDNESSIPVKETLKPYLDSGWVTVHTIEGKGRQLFAYDHCLRTHGSDSRWIGFIDTDEFIIPRQGISLAEFLKPFESFGGLGISSLFFGSGGNKIRPDVGQIAGYQWRGPDTLSLNRLVKMIVQPEKVILPISPHSFLFKEGWWCVNESGLRVDAQRFPCHVEKIQVNHYYTRSEEEWAKKLSRGRGDAGDPYSDIRWTRIHQFTNVKDGSAVGVIQKILDHSGSHLKVTKNNLLKVIHRVAMEKTHPPCVSPADGGIAVPREELAEYYNEVAIGPDLIEAGRLPEARDFYARQISKFPFDVTRYTNMAFVCLKLGDYQTTWSLLAQAWRIAPQSLFVLYGMIDYFYTIGDFAKVEKTSLLAAAQGELEHVGIATLALARWKLGKKEEARSLTQSLIPLLSESDRKEPLFKELLETVQ